MLEATCAFTASFKGYSVFFFFKKLIYTLLNVFRGLLPETRYVDQASF